MSVTRDKRNGTWYVQAWYKTYDGKRAHKVKRGFKTKPEALAWERDFYAVQAGDMDMKLVDFLELYKKDMGPRLRLNTWKTKESIITKRILPYLGEKRMNQIAPVDIVRWQNELMALEKPSGGGFLRDLPQDRQQPALRALQPRRALLRLLVEPVPQDRVHGLEVRR